MRNNAILDSKAIIIDSWWDQYQTVLISKRHILILIGELIFLAQNKKLNSLTGEMHRRTHEKWRETTLY